MSDEVTVTRKNVVDRIYDILPKAWQDKLYDRAVEREANVLLGDAPERAGLVTKSQWYGDAKATADQLLQEHNKQYEPSAELNAVMALSGDRTNAGLLPQTRPTERDVPLAANDGDPNNWVEAVNDGVHLLTKPITDEAIRSALLGPAPTGQMAEATEKLRNANAADARLDVAAEGWRQNMDRTSVETDRLRPDWSKVVWTTPEAETAGTISVVKSSHGIVARENYPDGAQYARTADGSWQRSASEQQPWTRVSKDDVPARFRDAIETREVQAMDTRTQQKLQLTPQQFWTREAQAGMVTRASATEAETAVVNPDKASEQGKLRLT